MIESPVIIINDEISLYGILGHNHKSDNVVILLPALTGTRTGPQRIYVEICQELSKIGIAYLRIDLPPNGDSRDETKRFFKNEKFEVQLIRYYEKYLNVIHNYLDNRFAFVRYYLLSISLGCIPILKYGQIKGYSGVILLSPDLLLDSKISINIQNIRSYYLKIFEPRTWHKLLTFKLNWRKILSNILNINIYRNKKNTLTTNPAINRNLNWKIDVLCVLGGSEPEIEKIKKYWRDFSKNNKQTVNYSEEIIENADHNFLGWILKKNVTQIISKWIESHERRN